MHSNWYINLGQARPPCERRIPAHRESAQLVNLVNPVQSFPGSRPTRGRNAIPTCRESARIVECRLTLEPFTPFTPFPPLNP